MRNQYLLKQYCENQKKNVGKKMCLNVILHKLSKFHYNQTINDMIFLPWIRGKIKINISSVLRKE